MRLENKYVVFAVICGVVLMSSAVFAQNVPAKKIVFPEVDGWEKGDVATYPTADLGYSIPYQSETGGIVTVYVYDGGIKQIADGIDDANVKNEIKKAENDIRAYGEAGYYQDVKLIKSETVTLGGVGGIIKALYSLFSFKVRGASVDSEIYLFGYQNKIIKIRATRAKGNNGAENSAVNILLAEFEKVFALKPQG